MMKVLIYAPNPNLYLQEFDRRFRGKFPYQKSAQGISWKDMRIIILNNEPLGCRADIAIGFEPPETGAVITFQSCINIKEKRITTYFDLLGAINDDGTFNWQTYLKQKDNDEWLF